MSHPIAKALEDAAQRMGRKLGKDAAKAVGDMYSQVGDGTKKVVKNIQDADGQHAHELINLANKVAKNGGETGKGSRRRMRNRPPREGTSTGAPADRPNTTRKWSSTGTSIPSPRSTSRTPRTAPSGVAMTVGNVRPNPTSSPSTETGRTTTVPTAPRDSDRQSAGPGRIPSGHVQGGRNGRECPLHRGEG